MAIIEKTSKNNESEFFVPRDYPNLSEAIAAINASADKQGTIVITTKIIPNYSPIPEKVTIRFLQGGIIEIPAKCY